MKTIILAGGFGTRLSSVVSDLPKPMAPVDGRPFLEYLILKLKDCGLQEIILSLGYKAEIIQSYFGDGDKFGVKIGYCIESSPLGTAGALKQAAAMFKDEVFLALNGDSFSALDFKMLINGYIDKKAIATIALTVVEDGLRYGSVEINDNLEITKFSEKSSQRKTLINTGTYCLHRRIFDNIASGKVSIEEDVFPGLLGQGLYGYVFNGFFIDIGIPEDYLYLCQHPDILH